MRRIALIVTALFLVGSAGADVVIIVEDLGDGVVEISYDATSEGQLVRAFALDIVATDGNIIDINDYAIGDDNGGYGIFPGSFAGVPIDVDPTTGLVENWDKPGYTPIAPPGAPDALGGLGTSGVTIEMGSLYDTVAPGSSGVLCTITVDENVTMLCVTGNAIRGNVVLENADEATLDVEACSSCIGDGCGGCFPTTPDYAIQYANWVALGKPPCWCEDQGYPGPTGNNQCYGDADGEAHSRGYIVYTTDLNSLANSWKSKAPEFDLDPCADFCHDTHSRGYVVYTCDLNRLATNWKKTDLPGDCPRPDGTVFPLTSE